MAHANGIAAKSVAGTVAITALAYRRRFVRIL
jgi:hypothetical protein